MAGLKQLIQEIHRRSLWQVLLIHIAAVAPVMQSLPANAQSAPDSVRSERLAQLGRVWGVVKYFHPQLPYNGVDWDSALVQAIPAVSSAITDAEYAAAVASMLDALNDPVTRVETSQEDRERSDGDGDPSWSWTADSILVVSIRNHADLRNMPAAASRLRVIADSLSHARRLLFDLRPQVSAPSVGMVYHLFDFAALSRKLVGKPLTGPDQRFRMHSGFPSQSGSGFRGFHTGWLIEDGPAYWPEGASVPSAVAFLVNEDAELPAIAYALHDAGDALIIAEGGMSDAGAVRTHSMRLTEKHVATVRLTELVDAWGAVGFAPDTVLSKPTTQNAGDTDVAFDMALALLRTGERPKAARSEATARTVPHREKRYRNMQYPPLEYRVMAAIKVWNTFHYFFPYKDLMDEDWHEVLKEFIPRMEAAADSLEYTLAVAEMVTHVQDTHAFINSRVLRRYFGVAYPSVRLRMIESVPVITSFVDESAARAAGAAIGDVVLSVDGEDAKTRFERIAKYLAASTPQSLANSVMLRFLAGPDSSIVTLRVRGADGEPRELELPRDRRTMRGRIGERSGDVLKLLPGNIGYADLDRLQTSEVDSMFALFEDTRAIIFDMRGYPNGTAWWIAPRLTEEKGVAAARFWRPVLVSPG